MSSASTPTFAWLDNLSFNLSPPLLTSIISKTVTPQILFWSDVLLNLCDFVTLGAPLCTLGLSPSNKLNYEFGDWILFFTLLLLSAAILVQLRIIRTARTSKFPPSSPHAPLFAPKLHIFSNDDHAPTIEVKMAPATHTTSTGTSTSTSTSTTSEDDSNFEWDLPETFAPLLSSPNLTVSGLETMSVDGLRKCEFGDVTSVASSLGNEWYKPWQWVKVSSPSNDFQIIVP